MTRLDLVVGPNGAGKTSFVTEVLLPLHPEAEFVNADEIAKVCWPGEEEARSYEAAAAAADTRAALIAAEQPFIAETVCSHRSKLDLIDDAHAAGFYVALHVLLVPLELSKARVTYRVAAGGHSVPTDKVIGRYGRLWAIVADAIEMCDVASCWDNSTSPGPTKVAAFTAGAPDWTPSWPTWTPEELATRWPAPV